MSLTETVQLFKTLAKLAGGLFLLLILFRVGGLVYGILNKPPENPDPRLVAEAKFGKLPPLSIQTAGVEVVSNYSTRLDLITATLPQKPQLANVYPVLKAPYGLLSEDRAESVATAFKLTQEPVQVSPDERLWSNSRESLRINVKNLHFKYEYRYQNPTNLFTPGLFTSKQALVDTARDRMNTYKAFGGFANDLVGGKQVASLLIYRSETFQPVQSANLATAGRVDFKRKDIKYSLRGKEQSYKFVTPSYVGSPNYILLGGQKDQTGKEIKTLEVQYTLWKYDANKGSSYPVISSRQAWENIQKTPELFTVYVGNLELGPLDRQTVPTLESFRAERVEFAYYDPIKEQDYLQPVWVFIGETTVVGGTKIDWVAYVPAVHPDYLEVNNQGER